MKPAGIHMAYLFVLAVLFAHSNCRAQDCNYVFGSRIVNDSTLSSVRDCHVSNKTQRTGTVSNVYGDFRITASVNDSISFSAIGYEELTIALTDSIFTRRHVIRLKPIAYELGEVTITPYHLDLPPISKFSIPAPAPLPGQGGVNIPTGISPVTFLYDRFSKEGKQKRYYGKLTEGTADFMLIGEKFNGELVSQITGLKEEELIKFMSFCGFSSDFLKNYSPETIKRAIREKYKAYRKNFPEGR